MRLHTKVLLRVLCAFVLAGVGIVPILSQQARNQAQQNAQDLRIHQVVRTKSGIVLLGYASETKIAIVKNDGSIVLSTVVTNTKLLKVPLAAGVYEVRSDDETLIVASDLNAYEKTPVNPVKQGRSAPSAKAQNLKIRSLGPPMQTFPVPWVADNTYAGSPPSDASRHVVFNGVQTRLKVAVKGGKAPYTVTWNPGDGGGLQSFTPSIHTNLALDVPANSTSFPVNSVDGFNIGDNVTIDPAPANGTSLTAETFQLTGINPSTDASLDRAFPIGTTVFSLYGYYPDGFNPGDAITISAPSGSETLTVAANLGHATTKIHTGHTQTSLNDSYPNNTTVFKLVDVTGFTIGDTIKIDGEGFTVSGVDAALNTITVDTASVYTHAQTAPVIGALPVGTTVFPVNSAAGFQQDDEIYIEGYYFTVASVDTAANTITVNNPSTIVHGDPTGDAVLGYGGDVYDSRVRITTTTPSTLDHGQYDLLNDPLRITVDHASGLPHAAGVLVVTTDNPNIGYNSCVLPWTYSKAIGSLIHASVTITDSVGNSGAADYWIRVGDPSNQTDRVARSTDEGLWFLHTQMTRQTAVANYSNRTQSNEPAVDEGFIKNSSFGYYTVAPSSMFAIALENSAHSVEGGVNFSHQAAKDIYVEDLNLLINYLTDTNTLADIAPGNYGYDFAKTYATGGSLTSVDTHPSGGNGYILMSNAGLPIYEGGMHLQAISQAGYVDKAVPNRSEYSSYYDLIGDFVDGFQYSQATMNSQEGGWRYGFSYGDSDGSAVAWAAIGLRAAELANDLTPAPKAHPGGVNQIKVDPLIKSELKIWLQNDQAMDATIKQSSHNYSTNADYDFHVFGGMGYTGSDFGMNAGKTGGGIVALKYVGFADTDTQVVNSIDFLYRNFYNYDYTFGWSSARDAYGMYNMLKGLTDAHITTLSQSATPGATDSPGNTVTSIPWYNQFADFIAGTGQMITDDQGALYLDLGHQDWPGNHFNFQYYGGTGLGHYEPTGVRAWAVGPLAQGEWGQGASDSNANVNLITAWDLAVLTGQVFTSGPVASFGHPTGSETTVPETVNGQPYNVVFDPGGSTDKNPNGTIIKVTWDFGDGSAPVTYTLGTPGPAGGAVPLNIPGNRTTHAYTFPVANLPKTVTVTLTVYDDQGLSDTKTEQLTVVNGVATPIARFAAASTNSRQSGDTIGILDAGADFGKVTIQFDGSASANPNPAGVNPKKNVNGISAFAWEWPTALNNTTTSDGPNINPGGQGGDPFGLDEGATDGTMTLNAGSKAPIQSYTFNFGPDQTKWPTSIQVSLKVNSNLPNVPGVPADNNTVVKTFRLLPNSQMPVTTLTIANLTLHNTTDKSTVISFDTTDAAGVPVASTGRIDFGLTTAYGSHSDDTMLRTHHDITVSGLSSNTTYHYKAHAEGGTQIADTADGTFKTLVTGIGLVISYSNVTKQANGQISVTWRATNNGTADAVNFKAFNFGATNPVTVVSVNGVAQPPAQTVGPVTIKSGGDFTEFTVVYGGVASTSTYFFAKFSYSYTGFSGSTGNIKVSGF